MSSSTTQYPLDILIDRCPHLFVLLKNIKDKHKHKTTITTSEEVKDIVSKVLNGLETAPPDAGLTKESIQKLLEKIESILEDFIKHDSGYKSVYEQLTQDVCSFNQEKQGSDLVTETSAEIKMSSSTTQYPLDILIDRCPHIFVLLKNIKDKHKTPSEEVKDIVSKVLNGLETAPTDGLTKESIQKLVEKIKSILEDFIKHDSDYKSVYEKLTQRCLNLQKQGSDLVTETSAEIKMSSSNTQYHLDILIDQGKRLFKLHKNIKDKHKTPSEEVKDIVSKVLDGLEIAPPDAGLIKESIQKLVEKIESILEDFIKHDSDYKSVYEKLTQRCLNLQKQGSDLVTETSADSAAVESSEETVVDWSQPDYEELVARQCLWCFLFFPAGAEIKKREIIHCWLGLNFNKFDNLVFLEETLANYVKKGLIERTFKNKKWLNRYKMTKRVHNRVSKQQGIRIKEEGSYTMLHYLEIVNPLALLNVSQTTLTAARLKKVCQMDGLQVLHLGNWRQEPEKYIVIEDVEAFRHLRLLREDILFLSLEGVTGMVKLPEYVYELTKLKVLDVRGCNNLENIPSGINSLRDLTHLDFTGCYLLDHLPLEICTLSALVVLKGFIVTEDDISEQEKVNNGKEKRRRGKARQATSIPCPFHELSKLEYLKKLTIHTRKVTFPTSYDLETISRLQWLECLRITWGKNSKTESSSTTDEEYVGLRFPLMLTKLELQAATHQTASRILRLISQDRLSRVEKLYLKGGGLKEIEHVFPRRTTVRLRYLTDLQIKWDDFRTVFPNLDRLEVEICPNLIEFPCDENGIWVNSPTDETSADYGSQYRNLTYQQQQYLCCFLLFPAGAEIKKREIIHCWIGLSPDYFVLERILDMFVAKGLIERTFKNKKLLNRYTMTKEVHDIISKQLQNRSRQNGDAGKSIRIKEEGSYNILYYQGDEKVDPFALLNVSQTTLTAAWLKKVSQMDTLRILYLGSWRQEHDNYIVIEDVEAFRHLRRLYWSIGFLSLEGVTGMEKLPEYVYELINLSGLDLRGCNNLENIPRGINSLRYLTHLDFTGCYLLDHLPLEICTLKNLIVLKGFVVTEDDISVQEKKKQVNNGKEKRRRGKARQVTSIPCPFHELSKLVKLVKLTIHTRKVTFPTSYDLETIFGLQKLQCLRITWGKNSKTESSSTTDEEYLATFSISIKKLELQAATHQTASRILRLISEDSYNCVEKLYLKGGGLKEIKHVFPRPITVRLRFLLDLQIQWDDFRTVFPNLDRLEVENCPNVILIPCDENGIWVNSQSVLEAEISKNESPTDEDENVTCQTFNIESQIDEEDVNRSKCVIGC